MAERAVSGNEAAIAELFGALLPRVRNLVRYLVRNDAEVDDLSQDALVAILRGLPSYNGEGSFRSWSDRVVARCVFAGVKQRARRAAELRVEARLEEARSPGDSPDGEPDRRRLARLLDVLSNEQRQVIVCHHVLGYSLPELALEIGIPLESCRSRLRLGKQRLRQLWDIELLPQAEATEALLASAPPLPRVLRTGGGP
jgi:RNA polymerase sigma-70 factor (ECF subfamily)